MPIEQTPANQPVETSAPMPTESNQATAATKPASRQRNLLADAGITGSVVAAALQPFESIRTSTRPSILTVGRLFFGKSKILNVAPATNVALAITAEHNQTSNPQTLAQTGTLLGYTAGMDAVLSGNYSLYNQRAHQYLNTGTSLEQTKRKVSYQLQGIETRFARNMVIATGLAIQDKIKGQVKGQVQEKTGIVDPYASTIVSGLAVGAGIAAAATPFNNISAYQSRMMLTANTPQEALSAPSMLSTAKNIAAKEGYKGFFRGAPMNAAAMATAAVVIDGFKTLFR